MSVDIIEKKSYHHLIMYSLFETADIIYGEDQWVEFYRNNIGTDEDLRSFFYKLSME